MENKPFVHLHVHTEYSLLDGAARIKKLFPLARKMGMPAVAMTDHGNMYGTMVLFDEAEANWLAEISKLKLAKAKDEYKARLLANPDLDEHEPTKDDIAVTAVDKETYKDLYIKPIIGCEFYMVEDMHEPHGKNDHLVLLAKNNTGLYNLMKLNSLAWTEGMYAGKPRLDMECLSKHSEGLICLSACIAGRIPRFILEGNLDQARSHAKRLASFFAPGDFYLEMQDHNIIENGRPLEKIVNNGLRIIAKEMDLPLVVTNDAHYIAKEDAEMHDVLLCIQTAAYLDEENRMRFSGSEFYLKSYAEMKRLFPDDLDALDRTLEIAAKIDVKKPGKDISLQPKYALPEGYDKPIDYLRKLCMDGLVKRYGEVTPEIMQRAEYELSVISHKYSDYYLVVWDFIDWAKRHGIPVGAGRGSGVGSIVAYAIGITNVEPLRYSLIFERFLNTERVSDPDFDVDFCSEGREKVIEYVIDKYGRSNVTQIVTFGTLAAKQAIKDVARVYRVPFAEVERMTKPIPNVVGCSIKGVMGWYEPDDKDAEKLNKMRSNDLIALYNEDPTVKRIIDMAAKVEGMPRNTGMHAAGVVICSKPVIDHIALQVNVDKASGKLTTTTQFPKDPVEGLGFLKMDFLGLTNLTDLKYAKQYIKENTGRDIDFAVLGYEDPNVYSLIGSGETDAVFQLESGGMKSFMRQLRPTCMEDIIAGISLYRPGPMDSIPKYVHNKNNPQDISYLDPRLKPILENTYGCLVYQEQVMDISRKLAGYSYGSADNLRRIMSKKKVKLMEAEKLTFLHGRPHQTKLVDGVEVEVSPAIPGAIKMGMTEADAIAIYNDMASFAKYAFNKSHAAAYAVVSYETAYMKRYYPQEFITAVMNNRIDKPNEIEKYITYLRDHGVPIYPPCVNKGNVFFSTDGKSVRYGLTSVKGVGEEASRKLVEERQAHGPYKDLQDLLSRQEVMLNKTMIEGLIKSGAMDCFGETRATLMANYDRVVAAILSDRKKTATGQISMFDLGIDDLEDMTKVVLYRLPEMDKELILDYEKDLMNVYMSGHPLEDYRENYKEISFTLDSLVEETEDEDSEEDIEGEVRCSEKGVHAGKWVKVAGIISNLAKKPDRNGNDFVTGILEDLTGKVEFVCFSSQYAQYKAIFANRAIVAMEGKLNYRDGKYSLSVNRATAWTKRSGAPLAPVEEARYSADDYCLLLQVFHPGQDESIGQIATQYPGDMEVYTLEEGKFYRFGQKLNPCESAISALSILLGSNNVIFKQRKK